MVGCLATCVSAWASPISPSDVTVPHVQAPGVPALPAVPKPPVQLPAVPKLPVPANPAGGSVQVGGSPSLPPAAFGGSPNGGGGGSGSGSPSGGSPTGGGAPATSAGPGAAPAGGRTQTRESRAQLRRRRAGERRFRNTVKQLSSCLPAANGFERRVLALRAGLGHRPARSRIATASRLHASMGRVARAEHTGVRRLRHAHSSGGCSPAAGAGATSSGGGTSLVGRAIAQVAITPTSTIAALLPVGDLAAGSVLAAHASSDGKPVAAASLGDTSGNNGSGASPFLWVPALLMLLGALVLTRLRRRGHKLPPPPWAR